MKIAFKNISMFEPISGINELWGIWALLAVNSVPVYSIGHREPVRIIEDRRFTLPSCFITHVSSYPGARRYSDDAALYFLFKNT